MHTLILFVFTDLSSDESDSSESDEHEYSQPPLEENNDDDDGRDSDDHEYQQLHVEENEDDDDDGNFNKRFYSLPLQNTNFTQNLICFSYSLNPSWQNLATVYLQ